MPAVPKVCKAIVIVASALVLPGWVIAYGRADEPAPREHEQFKNAQAQRVPAAGAYHPSLELVQQPEKLGYPRQFEKVPVEGADGQAEKQGAATKPGTEPGQEFDPAVVRAGQAAFERSCTKCHDAARALDVTKDLDGWRATVRKMAAKKDAEIAAADMEPIAVYLTSRTAAAPAAPTQREKPGAAAAGQRFDPAVVSAGQAAFERSCTKCHDAARSLERTKDLAGWRATVRRMAAKTGADIASGDIEPIAVYLASRSAGANGGAAAQNGQAGGAAAGGDGTSLSTFATLSPLWRGSDGRNDQIQNSGFGPLAWIGANWSGKTVSGRVTACVACHGVQEQAFLSRFDLVEAAVRVDLTEYLPKCLRGLKVNIDAGRFMVPFGAFSAQANPGTYRTVSTPLIFNMGQRVFNRDIGDTVLPMPYTDTGVDLNLNVPLGKIGNDPISATLDGYLLNGLQGSSSGIDFLQSRNLLDFNNRPAGGGRFTVGDPYIRVGASFMGGRFDDPNDASVPDDVTLDYTVFGVDLQAKYKKLFRCQVEYARRRNDRIGVIADGFGQFSEKIDGYYLEAEVRPWQECCMSLLARQDFFRRISPLPPPGSTVPTGTYNVERFTFGVNFELWQQSLLMFNVERWFLPEPNRSVNVFGIRYTITF
jgi:cytochrome c2